MGLRTVVTEPTPAAYSSEDQVGRIQLKELLGKGGMGEVYAGFDAKLRRPVAVKVLHHGRFGTMERARLLREAQLLSQLRHPYVCQVYDLIEGEETDHLILELIEGRTLRDVIREGIELPEALRYAQQIADALTAAHDQGIVHRDLKPENVMITGGDSGSPSRIKVLDFGVARMLEIGEKSKSGALNLETEDRFDREVALQKLARLETDHSPDGSRGAKKRALTLTGAALGTPGYMSPEQAGGQKATAASDMFAFGLLLQELVTGQPAYDRDLPLSTLMRRCRMAQTRPREGLDPELDKLCARLQSLAPAARPAAADVAERLREIRNAPRRRLRRRLQVAAIAVLIMLALTMTTLAVRLSKAVEEADRQASIADARRLTAQAMVHLSDHLDRSLLLSIEAYKTADILEARSSLFTSLETSPLLHQFLRVDARFHTVAWSPDKSLLAAGCDDGAFRLWKAESDELAAGPIKANEGFRPNVWSVRWSPNGKLLATTGSRVRLWEVDEETRVRPLPAFDGIQDLILRAVWDPHGEEIATACDDGTMRVWNVASRSERMLRQVEGSLWAVDWHPDGSMITAAGTAGKVWIWDAATGDLMREIQDPSDTVYDVVWSPAGDLLAAAAQDKVLRFWDVEKDFINVHQLNLDGDIAVRLAWSPDSRNVAIGTRSGLIRFWNEEAGILDGPRLRGHSAEITELNWSADGKSLASASHDTTLVIWSVDASKLPAQPFAGHLDTVRGLAISPDGSTLASTSYDQTVRLWDTETGAQKGDPLLGHSAMVTRVSWDPTGRYLATSGEESKAFVWDVARREVAFELDLHQAGVVVAWSPDGKYLVTASRDQSLALWDAPSATVLKQIQVSTPLFSVAWSPSSQRVAAVGRNGSTSIWNIPDLEPLGKWQAHGGRIYGLAWSPDGRQLATAGLDGEAYIWDPGTGRHIASLSGHTGPVRYVGWSPDGRLLTASEDHTAIVWDGTTYEPEVRISHRQRLFVAAWTSDGRLFLGGDDFVIHEHDLSEGPEKWREHACQRVNRNLTLAEWHQYRGKDVEYMSTCPEHRADDGVLGNP